MSYSQLITFCPSIAEPDSEYPNGHGTGWRVWYALATKYGGEHSPALWIQEHLFRTWESVLQDFEKTVLLFTCDYAITRRGQFPQLVAALRKFVEVYPSTGVCHLCAIADRIEAFDETVEAVALYCSSNNENLWTVYERNRWRPYDLSKDTEHWTQEEVSEM